MVEEVLRYLTEVRVVISRCRNTPLHVKASKCCILYINVSIAARVVVNLRVVSLVEGVAFRNSSYNFSLLENQPAGLMVGRVWASSGSNLYNVSYTLKTHADLFSVDASGAVLTRTVLDKEKQEWYFLDVEAVDTRTPPTTAVAMV